MLGRHLRAGRGRSRRGPWEAAAVSDWVRVCWRRTEWGASYRNLGVGGRDSQACGQQPGTRTVILQLEKEQSWERSPWDLALLWGHSVSFLEWIVVSDAFCCHPGVAWSGVCFCCSLQTWGVRASLSLLWGLIFNVWWQSCLGEPQGCRPSRPQLRLDQRPPSTDFRGSAWAPTLPGPFLRGHAGETRLTVVMS